MDFVNQWLATGFEEYLDLCESRRIVQNSKIDPVNTNSLDWG
jgi:hypothetical protein